ncbi:MAG: glycosyltransferase family 2 protein [Planctomycetota bacterium]|nr:MAG: glycosyltransferase family 2 protein [Planctomycetota bacterium]
MTPRVSILIPCYNASATVERAVDSALAQTFRDIEVIVADDGSTDSSLAVLERYRGDARVAVHAEPHRGGNGTRNRLIELAQGEFVQFLDADDELDPEKVEICLAAFAPGIDMVYTNHRVRNGRETIHKRLPEPIGDMISYFVANSVAIHEPLHRRSLLVGAAGFDESLPCCQEYELHLRLACRFWQGMKHIPESRCTVYVTPGSVSSNKGRIFSTKARVLLKFLGDWQDAGIVDDRRRKAVAEELLGCVRQLCFAGRDEEALELFSKVRRLSPATAYPGKWPLRLAVRLVGPVRAERARTWLTGRGAKS